MKHPFNIAALITLGCLAVGVPSGGAAHDRPVEGTLDAFLGAPTLHLRQVFTRDRFPNVVVAMDGTVLAFWNGVVLRRSEDGGRTWGGEILVGRGFMGGGVTVDETSGDILAFVEAGHPPSPLTVYRSRDHGRTWQTQETVIRGNQAGHVPAMHMNEHGITLRHGQHRGRLLRPSRWYTTSNARENWPQHYTGAICSDDGGKTWQASEPFPVMGTGEACVVELSDGRIYYNSRRHWAPTREEALHRWVAWSEDGGATWKDPLQSSILPDGNQDSTYGLMGGLVRLPVQGRDILVFSNIDSQKGRRNGMVWASFDGGRTWPIRRVVYPGNFAYSSLNAGRPGTPSEGWVYLFFEGGPEGGGTVARVNLSWILAGEQTGDGTMPGWLLAAAGLKSDTVAKADTIRVMTYNLWIGGEAGGQPLVQSARVIEAAYGDIVGVQELIPRIKAGDAVVLTGDFNEPSHQDWIPAVVDAGLAPLAVPYPTTRRVVEAGMIDAYRAVHPNPVSHPGWTWTPITSEDDPADRHDRIDMIFTGPGLVTTPVEEDAACSHAAVRVWWQRIDQPAFNHPRPKARSSVAFTNSPTAGSSEARAPATLRI